MIDNFFLMVLPIRRSSASKQLLFKSSTFVSTAIVFSCTYTAVSPNRPSSLILHISAQNLGGSPRSLRLDQVHFFGFGISARIFFIRMNLWMRQVTPQPSSHNSSD